MSSVQNFLLHFHSGTQTYIGTTDLNTYEMHHIGRQSLFSFLNLNDILSSGQLMYLHNTSEVSDTLRIA